MLSANQTALIEKNIKASIRRKLRNHAPEPAVMPFHTRLLGRDRIALYAFIHSLNTNFGTSIFEPVAALMAEGRFKVIRRQETVGELISRKAQAEIQRIMDELTTARQQPNQAEEIAALRRVCKEDPRIKINPTKADLYLERNDGKIYLFDIKTAKPNKKGFESFKRMLMEWNAVMLAKDSSATISSEIAIPYNPYDPKPYSRWTMAGMLDVRNELKVAKEFWDFLGGDGAYEQLLDCFQRAGIALKKEIDDCFSNYAGSAG